MTPEAWARTVEDFLAGARDAIVLDGGAAVFDLAQAKYSISGERNKYLLHDTCCTISRRKPRGVVGIDERWRDGVRAVFRKRPRDMELKIDPRSRDCA